ncbi:MAG: hypothetical protein ACRELD_07455 [Longimicrobiales bacterium]
MRTRSGSLAYRAACGALSSVAAGALTAVGAAAVQAATATNGSN